MRSLYLSLPAVAIILGASACHDRSRVDTKAPESHSATENPRHANYLRALTDLKEARAHLARKPATSDVVAKNDASAALAAVDRAIVEVKNAAHGNGKELDEAPKMEADTSPRDAQLHKALDQLKAAKKSVAQAEDNVEVKDERKRAMHEIDEAIRLTEDTIKAAAKST